MKLQYTVQIWHEDDQYAALAMPIDVVSSGDSPESARQAVDEAVKLFLSTTSGHGTLRQVLEDVGYRRIRGEWRCPVWSGFEQRSVLAEV